MKYICLLLIYNFSIFAFAEGSNRALPVDPAEITPDLGIDPNVDHGSTREAQVIDVEEVKLAPHQPGKAADSDGLPHDLSREDAVRLQIFLDQNYFGPGIIDGKPGRFTILAIEAWNEAHGHAEKDYQTVLIAARSAVTNPFAMATVPYEASAWVNGNLPHKRAEQAKQKRMSYRSYGEFMAERYHCDVPFLAELNGWTMVNRLSPGKAVIVPNVRPFLIEYMNGSRYQAEEMLTGRYVLLDTKTNQARIYEQSAQTQKISNEQGSGDAVQVKAERKLIAAFPITPGQERFIKYGVWKLANAVQLPVWRYDQSLLDGKGRSNNSLNIPPGPNSPVGIMWMGLNLPGIGMHGTSNPETIGRSRSAGCIRFANWDAIRLPDFVRPGTTVEIR